MGLRSTETVKRLSAVQTLSLVSAMDICRADEADARDTKGLRSGGPAMVSVHRLHAEECGRGA